MSSLHFTFNHLADAFIQSNLQMRHHKLFIIQVPKNIHKNDKLQEQASAEQKQKWRLKK